MSTQQPAKQSPVPSKAALAKAEDLVNDIFKEEIAKAQTPESQVKLANYLVQQGDECGDDPAARFVLFNQARDLAIRAGDVELALAAIDKMARFFEVSGLDLKAATTAKLVDSVAAKEPSKALAELTLSLMTEALVADNYETAMQLAKTAAEAAKKSQVVSLVNAVAKRAAEVRAAREKFSVLQPYVDRLKKDPEDAEANWKMGEYFGLFKGKWDRAVPLLAKSKKEPICTLARTDLAGPKDTKDQVALADDWWSYAVKEPQPQQTRLQERAAFWYDKALPSLAGLSRTKAQKRIDQVVNRSQPGQVVAAGPVGLIRVLEGHTGEIRAVAFSDDARFGLSGSTDNTMRLWNLDTGKDQIFRGHLKQVSGVAFVPGGRHLLSASWDGTAKLWDLATAKDIYTFSHPSDVNAVVVSKDGKWMLTGCDDKQMRLWDLGKREEVRRFLPHKNFCYACAFAPDRLQVASGGADHNAMVFELATGKMIREVVQNGDVNCVAFSPDSKYLFTCGDSAVHMWDIGTGREERHFDAQSGFMSSMALTPDGHRLLTGGDDKSVRIWDVHTGKEMKRFEGHDMAVKAVAISLDGRRALSGQTDGQIRYWGLPAR